jgi:hypothetical protein
MSPHECTAPICPLIFDPRFDPQSIPTRGHNVGTNPVSGETDISTPPELQYAYFGGSRTDAEAAPPQPDPALHTVRWPPGPPRTTERGRRMPTLPKATLTREVSGRYDAAPYETVKTGKRIAPCSGTTSHMTGKQTGRQLLARRGGTRPLSNTLDAANVNQLDA